MRVLVVTSLYPNEAQPHKAPFNRQQMEALASMAEVRMIAPVPFTKAFRRGASGATAHRSVALERRGGVMVSHPTYFFTPKVMRGRVWLVLCSQYRRGVRALRGRVQA
jgi:hypothetical protein